MLLLYTLLLLDRRVNSSGHRVSNELNVVCNGMFFILSIKEWTYVWRVGYIVAGLHYVISLLCLDILKVVSILKRRYLFL